MENITPKEFIVLQQKIENDIATPEEQLQYLETLEKGLDTFKNLIDKSNLASAEK